MRNEMRGEMRGVARGEEALPFGSEYRNAELEPGGPIYLDRYLDREMALFAQFFIVSPPLLYSRRSRAKRRRSGSSMRRRSRRPTLSLQ